MRPVASITIVLLLAACAKSDQPPADAQPASAATVSLADFAGTWSMKNVLEDSAKTEIAYEIMATANPTGWMLHLPNRDPVPLSVVLDGDSVVTEAGPFESVLRPGVQVTTRTVNRLEGGRIVGRFKARYSTGGADSVSQGRVEGTRKP